MDIEVHVLLNLTLMVRDKDSSFYSKVSALGIPHQQYHIPQDLLFFPVSHLSQFHTFTTSVLQRTQPPSARPWTPGFGVVHRKAERLRCRGQRWNHTPAVAVCQNPTQNTQHHLQTTTVHVIKKKNKSSSLQWQ